MIFHTLPMFVGMAAIYDMIILRDRLSLKMSRRWLFWGILERQSPQEIAHIPCGAVEEEVSCDTGNLWPRDPH